MGIDLYAIHNRTSSRCLPGEGISGVGVVLLKILSIDEGIDVSVK
jgi:hypothetical protein